MHVGMSTVFQNPHRFTTDREVYRNEVRLTDLAEPLGYESIWGVEHHFTDYTMCPDVVQWLAFMAGRTSTAKLGSMVVVLPWHDPMRVAEEVSMLDSLSGGRMIFGIGRGLGRVEYEGFRLDMNESRDRFVESAQMVLNGLETGYCESQGKYINQPRKDIRPAPFKSFKGRTYAAAVSPESVKIMSELGVGLLIIPQKPWEEVAKEITQYRETYQKLRGAPPPAPIACGWAFCDESEERAHEMARKYIGGYWRSVMDHYEFTADHFKNIKGYEYYGKMSDKIFKYGNDVVSDFFLNLQVWGTPEQCYERIMKVHSLIENDSWVGVFSYAGMPYDEAERSMRLFAKEVIPELKAFQPQKMPVWAEAATAVA